MISNVILKRNILLDIFSKCEDKCDKIAITDIMSNYDSKRKPVSKENRGNLENKYDYYGATGKIDMVDNYLFDGSYLLIGEDGGNFFVDRDNAFIVKGKFWANNHVHVLSSGNEVTNRFVMHYLNSLDLAKMGLISGVAVPKLNQKNLNTITIPIPSIEEQTEIVNKIESLFELIDIKEKNDQEKQKLKDILKEKILDSAIQGLLVEQNKNEESSTSLIEHILRIRDELIERKELRKDTKISTEIPSKNLPVGWNWIRLGDIGVFKKGPFGSSLTKDMFVEDGINSFKVYEQKNAIQKDWKLGNYFITKEKFDNMQSFVVKPNDIIVSCAGTIGEIYVIPDEARIGIINQALMKITLHDTSIMKYFLIYFDHVLKGETREKGKGSAITNIPPFDVLKNIYIPLPPLEEQKRIVEKIEQCFELIEQL